MGLGIHAVGGKGWEAEVFSILHDLATGYRTALSALYYPPQKKTESSNKK